MDFIMASLEFFRQIHALSIRIIGAAIESKRLVCVGVSGLSVTSDSLLE
jgi:hypothetical protein